MSEKAIHYGVLCGVLAVAGFVFTRGPSAHAPPAHARVELLSFVPDGAALELSCDFARLRASELGALVNEQLARVSGGQDLAARCGFDPLAQIDRLALAIPISAGHEPDAAGDFALLGAGRFQSDALVGCAERLIRDRGGEPTRSSLGALASVRDRKGSGGEVAARDGGPLVVSGGTYFREVVDLANLPHATNGQNVAHRALRQALGDGTLVVSWLVPEGWFGRVADDERAKVSALSGVSSLGARVDLGKSVSVTLLLVTSDEAAADAVNALLLRLKQSAASLLPDPLLASLAGRITIAREHERLRLQLELSTSEAQALLTRAGSAF